MADGNGIAGLPMFRRVHELVDAGPIPAPAQPVVTPPWAAPHASLPAPAPSPAPAPTPAPGVVDEPVTSAAALRQLSVEVSLDWTLVRQLRRSVANQLAERVGNREGISPEDRLEIGRGIVAQVVREDALSKSQTGLVSRTPAEEDALRQAVFDAAFRLGRLQPLVDDPTIDNIDVCGCQPVWLEVEGGHLRRGPAIADSDEELIEFLQYLAAHHGSGERAFNPSSPALDLSIGDIARINATAWLGGPPDVNIRLHSKKFADLKKLVELGMLSEGMAEFLSAAVKAHLNIIISGEGGAGKTTLTRALCHCIPWNEKIATLETDHELFLRSFPELHPRLWAAEARPGSEERGADGRKVGQFDLEWLLLQCLRKTVSRVIVGEMRGPEVMAACKAMQAAHGSLSTIHSTSGRMAIERMVTMMMSPANGAVSPIFAYRQVSQSIDLVVQVEVLDERDLTGGRRQRYVSEIFEVQLSDNQASGTSIFAPGPDGRARYAHQPSEELQRRLVRAGYDRNWSLQSDHSWAMPLHSVNRLRSVHS